MAIEFVVETGTGLPTATTYTDVAGADQYLENTGRKSGAWADAGNSGKQVALNAAFVYMFARWSDQWSGQASNEDQAGDWPRRNTFKRSGFSYGADEIPPEVLKAQIEYALIHVAEGGLILYPEFDVSNRPVTGKTEKVGPLSESVQYSDSSKPQSFRTYPIADNLLKNLVQGNSQNELLRA